MKSFKVCGQVEYNRKMLIYGQGEVVRKSTHTFNRFLEAESATEAYREVDESLQRKYKSRPNSKVSHEDIHITECKIYEMVEVKEW